MRKGQVMWRAALGCVAGEGLYPYDLFFLESIDPHPLERMKPRKDRAQEGRVNPKGIPCLYVATDAETDDGNPALGRFSSHYFSTRFT